MQRAIIYMVGSFTLLGQIAGCGDYLKRKQLEKVAKDWSMTIRASQVIPVYPLTEDLQPGDIFLVTTPVTQQVKLYKQKGFLPLDQLVSRLHCLDYKRFYRDAYWEGNYADTPHPRPKRDPPEVPDDGDPTEYRFDNVEAPRAVFPSYAFKVRSGSGLQLAVPVQGIPIGLNLMQADSATGSISIADAYTYAVPADELLPRVEAWAEQSAVKDRLAQLQKSSPDNTLYLRVVSRIYLTGAVMVSLTNDAAIGADVTGGVQDSENEPPPGLNLLSITDEESAANYERVREALNGVTASMVPRGRIKFAVATQRSVALREAFDRPVAIGYLGFDLPILEGGVLGVPIATRNQLLGEPLSLSTSLKGTVGSPLSVTAHALNDALDRYRALSDEQKDTVASHVAEDIGGVLAETFQEELAEGRPPRVAFEPARDVYTEANIDTGRISQGDIDLACSINNAIDALSQESD